MNAKVYIETTIVSYLTAQATPMEYLLTCMIQIRRGFVPEMLTSIEDT
jgi:hypothetical protein